MEKKSKRLYFQDAFLIGIMAVLAACGLIYEYLLSHYAGRILGALESAIYSMIGLMIVAMGLGAFFAKWLKDAFTSFAWLESLIAFLGMSAILINASIIALISDLPQLISQTYNLPPDTIFEGGIFYQLQSYAHHLPYVFGLILGFLIGMEIPLIARLREYIYGQHLVNNVGTVYGADYIGAGIGALIWVRIMLSMDIIHSAAWTALFNIVAGSIFLIYYWKKIRWVKWLCFFHACLLIGLLTIFDSGQRWMTHFSNVLYKDHVIYQTNTQFQSVTFTQRKIASTQHKVLDMYINGRLQFSSADEHIYHSMLTYPALLTSAKQEHILIIGGGDGLALRDVLKWQPKAVTLIDLDKELLSLFKKQPDVIQKNNSKETSDLNHLRHELSQLNEQAFSDPRVKLIIADAFLAITQLLDQQNIFDTIIVDLPDPSHPDLNKLYSDLFYSRLKQLLNADGSLVVQSTSPYHAKEAFICIAKTLKHAGFMHVDQYRQNIPSFGEWGWTIAHPSGTESLHRIHKIKHLPIQDDFMTLPLLKGAFAMPKDFYLESSNIRVNHLGSGQLYFYHHLGWEKDIFN